MKRVCFVFVLIFAGAVSAAAPSEAQLALALHDVNAEELVFDAQWKDPRLPLLEVRMFDNGSQRNGYAVYLCMIVSEYEINSGIVRVIDVVGEEERVLGEAACK